MKTKLNFRSRRTIIITSIIAILVIAALIGVYAFVKSNGTARAVDESQNSLEAQGSEADQSQDTQNSKDNNNASDTTDEETENRNQAQTTTDGIAGNGNAANGITAARETAGTLTAGTTTGAATNNGINSTNGTTTDATVTTDIIYDNVVIEEPWKSHSVAWRPETPQFVSPNVNTADENNKDVKTQVIVTKEWKDSDETKQYRPEVTFNLYNEANQTKAVRENVGLNENNQAVFTNLPKYDNAGNEIKYIVKENGETNDLIEGNTGAIYSVEYSGENGILIVTNKIDYTSVKTEIIGTKTWIDGGKSHDNSKEVKLTLTRTVTKGETTTEPEIVNATPVWNGSTYTYSNLEKYDAEGYEYTYNVTEVPVDGYTTKYDNYNITNTKNLMLYKKAVDESGNEIKKLIYKENNEKNNKFNYILTVVSQQTMNNKQKVTDELPKEITIDNDWKIPSNVTIKKDSKDNNRQIIEWTVDLSDENKLTQELTIPVKAENTLFNEYLKEETKANRTILDYTFTTAKDIDVSAAMSRNNDGKNVNIFLRTLNTAEASNNQGYIYAGTVKATDLAKTDQKDAYARIYDNNGNYTNRNYNDTIVNNILVSGDNNRIENMLDDFSRDNADAKNGIGKFIKGGLPSETLVNENLNNLYNGTIQLTKSQIILWYKVPASEDTSRSRHYTITSSANEEIFNGNVPLNECNYHIDGLIIDINHDKYIPLGTKVSVVNTAKLGELSATATLDIYYEIESDSRAKNNVGVSILDVNNTLGSALEQETNIPQAEQNQAEETTKEVKAATTTKANEQKDTNTENSTKTEVQNAESVEQTETTKDIKISTENMENEEAKTDDSAKTTTENTIKEETKNTEIKSKDSTKTENVKAETTETESKQENNIN